MLYAFVEATVGAVERVQAVDRGRTARVWCVETRSGRVAVKQHARGRAHAQESRALATLGAADGEPWPQLLASAPDLLAVVTTWLPGTPVDPSAITRTELAAIAREAGTLRRRFDEVPWPDDDPVPLSEAVAQRIAALLDGDVIETDLAAHVRAALRFDAFAGATRHFCHRDFAPHNWLVDRGRLRCVDFGHARPDHPLVDLARALSPVWGVPHARAELIAGYGGLDDDALAQLAQLELVDAVATLAWARRHGDAALADAAAAAAALDRLVTGQ
jgi:tRNA A-37 threonylcarbamoyl transferase component Bud32